MFDYLNKYGLPAKYGMMGFVGGLIGAYFSDILGWNNTGLVAYIVTPIAAGIGGAIGGWFRRRRGKTS